jgi:hypothetical protein
MLAIFLDEQVSQNSGSFGAPGTLLLPFTTELFGTLGLITSGAGPNLRVQFEATVTVSSIFAAFSEVTVTIVRGLLGPGIGPIVYTAVRILPNLGTLSTEVVTIAGSDFLPPNPGFLHYQAFVSTTSLGAVRVGPESFHAIAVSD